MADSQRVSSFRPGENVRPKRVLVLPFRIWAARFRGFVLRCFVLEPRLCVSEALLRTREARQRFLVLRFFISVPDLRGREARFDRTVARLRILEAAGGTLVLRWRISVEPIRKSVSPNRFFERFPG